MTNVVPICVALAPRPYAGTPHAVDRALLPSAAHRWWGRARLLVEMVGWLVTAASLWALA